MFGDEYRYAKLLHARHRELEARLEQRRQLDEARDARAEADGRSPGDPSP
jgi:hypothetical protein